MTYFTAFNVDGVPHHVASSEQVEAAAAMEGAPHVLFGCINCGCGYWHAKNLALGRNGGYTGSRNIFWAGGYDATKATECECPASYLRMIVPV
jgi:hypothetical protein